MQTAVGQQISASSGAFGTNSNTLTPVTNLSVTLTTSGRPVMILLQSDSSGSECYIGAATSTTSPAIGQFYFYRGATQLANSYLQTQNAPATTTSSITVPPSSMTFLDTPAAGTYTYTFQVVAGAAASVQVQYCVLAAYEL
jgi:hypothetical protein